VSERSGIAPFWRRPDPLVHRFEGRLGDLGDPRDLFETRFLRENDVVAAASWRPECMRAKGVSLARALRTHRRAGAQPTASGFETVDLPYPHVIAVLPSATPDPSQQSLDFAMAAQNAGTAAMESAWRDWIDPMVGARLRVFHRFDRGGGVCRVFFGEGVFAPEAGERAAGAVILRDPKGGRVSSPLLPDGEAAALHKGQSRLAFSGDGRRTPAVCDLLDGARGAFSLSPERGAEVRLAFHALGDGAATFPDITRRAGAADASFDVELPPKSALPGFTVEVVFDQRPSRLHLAPPPGLSLAIRGVMEPLDARGRPPRRWWIDLHRDSDPKLCFSAMVEARKSIVRQSDGYDVWDWLRPARRVPAERAGFRRMAASVGDTPREALLAPQPLGWLVPPERARPPAFAASGPAAAYALDWLDWAGAVERSDGSVARLAEWLQDQGEAALVPGRTGDPGAAEGFAYAAAPGGWRFARALPAALQPGQRFLAGGLLLECVAGGRPGS
jgi:hypothetical protein